MNLLSDSFQFLFSPTEQHQVVALLGELTRVLQTNSICTSSHDSVVAWIGLENLLGSRKASASQPAEESPQGHIDEIVGHEDQAHNLDDGRIGPFADELHDWLADCCLREVQANLSCKFLSIRFSNCDLKHQINSTLLVCLAVVQCREKIVLVHMTTIK